MTYPKKTGRRMHIPLTKPFFNKEEERAAVEVIRSGWHTQGPQTEAFENEIAKYVGAKYAIAVSSCTTALHLSLIIAGVGLGDEVIVPSFTYIATVNVIGHSQASTVFAEVDAKTLNIDPKQIEKKITKNTKAIIMVDQVGLPCHIQAISKIAKEHNLFLIEDAACALGSKYKGKKIGSMSAITCFSLHPRKIISTGEGGLITTNSKKIALLAKKLRAHGASISDHVRHKSTSVSYEKYTHLGYNFRITDIQAAIGREQLKKLPLILKKRKLIAERYSKKLAQLSSIQIPYVPPYAEHNWQSYIISLNANCPRSQKELMQKLLDNGISTRKGVMASHLEPYYKSRADTRLPITEALAKSTISLPIYPQMTKLEQDYVIRNIANILTK